MKNKIEDLRNHLFATLEALQDADKPMQLECARTIAEVAQVIINTAKVELDVMRAVGGTRGTGFIEMPAQDAEPATPRLVKGAAQSGGG